MRTCCLASASPVCRLEQVRLSSQVVISATSLGAFIFIRARELDKQIATALTVVLNMLPRMNLRCHGGGSLWEVWIQVAITTTPFQPIRARSGPCVQFRSDFTNHAMPHFFSVRLTLHHGHLFCPPPCQPLLRPQLQDIPSFAVSGLFSSYWFSWLTGANRGGGTKTMKRRAWANTK